MQGTQQTSTWHILGNSVRGASHESSAKPNQDAIEWTKDTGSPLPLVLAISDGHGSDKYFRSHIGAQFAVRIAQEEMLRFAREVAHTTNRANIRDLGEKMPRNIVYRWREQVEADWLNHPPDWKWLNQKEQGKIWGDIGNNHAIPYGATLLTALITENFLCLLQLGDGDILFISETGEVTKPIKGDARHLANETTSLCTSTAVNDFRLHLQWLSNPPALILLSTDGYANSFSKPEGFLKVGTDIWDMMQTEGVKQVEDSLPGWLEAATKRGSGDDITLGIICNTTTLERVRQEAEQAKQEAERARQEAEKISIPGKSSLPAKPLPSVNGDGVVKHNGSLNGPVTNADDTTQYSSSGNEQRNEENVSQDSFRQQIIVSQDGTGHYTSIGEAIQKSAPYAHILVHPGLYKESLVLDKPVEIKCEEISEIGIGVQYVILEGYAPCIQIRSNQVEVHKLHIQGKRDDSGKNEKLPAISIVNASPTLKECDVTSDTELCIEVHGSMARPTIRVCRIHHGKGKGLLFTDYAAGSVEECNIENHGDVSTQIEQGSSPNFKGCSIFQGRAEGLVVTSNSQATLNDCSVENHGSHNVVVMQSGNLIMQRTQVCYSQANGFFFDHPGQVSITTCKIYSNGGAGIEVRNGKNILLKDCQTYNGQRGGIIFDESCEGRLEDCRMYRNANNGIEILHKSKATLHNCAFWNGNHTAILIDENSSGTIEGGEIYNNAASGVEVRRASNARILNCKLFQGKMQGILFSEHSKGELEDCTITRHSGSGILVTSESWASLKNCSIEDNAACGIMALKTSKVIVEGCNIQRNTPKEMHKEDVSEITYSENR